MPSTDILLGVVTFILTILGGVVAVHAPTQRFPKIVYVALFVGLGGIGIGLAIKQSRETAVANANLTANITQLKDSNSEISRMTRLNTDLQGRLLTQSDVIANLSQQSVDQATGGDSYAVVSPIMIPVAPDTFSIGIHLGNKNRENSVLDAHVYLRRLPIPNEGRQSELMDLLQGKGDRPIFVGEIDPQCEQMLPTNITASETDITSYVINVYARNKPTTETLSVRRDPANGAWEYSYKIIRETKAGKPGKPGTFETLEVTKPEWQGTKLIESK